MYREEIIKRGERWQGAAGNAWRDHDTGSKSQSCGNLGNDEGCFIDTWLVDKNKGDNYKVISFLLVISLVVFSVKALTNLAFNKLLNRPNQFVESEVHYNHSK